MAVESQADVIQRMCAMDQQFAGHGWTRAGSRRYSLTVARDPLRLLTNVSQSSLRGLGPDDFQVVEVGSQNQQGTATDFELAVHGWLAGTKSANVILQTQSVWTALLADRFWVMDGVVLESHHLLGSLPLVVSLDHKEWLPIVVRKNAAAEQLTVMEKGISQLPEQFPLAPRAVIVQSYGLITWAESLEAAIKQVEVFEFFSEYLVRKAQLG